MNALGSVFYWVLSVFLLLLIVRVVISWVSLLAPQFRPTGGLVVIFEVVYTITDPPIRLLGRFIPPLRVGNIALDIGFILLFIATLILRDQLARI